MTEKSHPEASAEGFTQANLEHSSETKVSGDEITLYEVGFHIVPTVAEDKLGAVVERIRTALEKAEAKIVADGFPKRMTLAYRIERSVSGKREKYTESYFGFIRFEAAPGKIPALQASFTADHEILRFLLVEAFREEVRAPRAVFSSDRLEGETIHKPTGPAEEPSKVSDEELEKSIDALVR